MLWIVVGLLALITGIAVAYDRSHKGSSMKSDPANVAKDAGTSLRYHNNSGGGASL